MVNTIILLTYLSFRSLASASLHSSICFARVVMIALKTEDIEDETFDQVKPLTAVTYQNI